MWASAPKSPTADWVLLSPQARELESQEEELRCRDAFYKEQLGRLERQVGPSGPANPPPRSALGGGLGSSSLLWLLILLGPAISGLPCSPEGGSLK